MTKSQKNEIPLEGNRNVDRAVLDRAAELRSQLARHGISPHRGYRIAPALGGKISDDFSRAGPRATHGTSAWNVIPETDG